MAYYLDGTSLPSPKRYERQFMPVASNFTSMDGKESRDLRILDKEKYVLSWENLSKSELDSIMTIVNKNTPVIFYINETNLTVNSTEVHIRIGSIDYSTLGSDYLSNLTLELIETGQT
jgi:hypothetical protein